MKEEIASPPPNLNHGLLELKASVLPTSYADPLLIQSTNVFGWSHKRLYAEGWVYYCSAANSANIKKDIFADSDFDLISTPSERNATLTYTSGFGFGVGGGGLWISNLIFHGHLTNEIDRGSNEGPIPGVLD